MAPFWTDDREKTLLLHMLGPDPTISRAQASEIAKEMGASKANPKPSQVMLILLSASGDIIRSVHSFRLLVR